MRHRTPALVPLLLLCAALPAALLAAVPTRETDLKVVSEDQVNLLGVVVLPEPDGGAAPAAGWPVVILVHDYARTRDSIVHVADALAARGIASVVMDMRGHGRSNTMQPHGGYLFGVRPMRELHRAAADQDLIVRQLASVQGLDRARIAILGVGHGALIAAEAAARVPAIRALVMVDPVDPIVGFRPTADLGLLGSRPVLLVGSQLPQSRERVNALTAFGSGERTVVLSEKYATQDRVIGPETKALQDIAGWLAAKLGAAAPEGTAAAPAPAAVPTGETR